MKLDLKSSLAKVMDTVHYLGHYLVLLFCLFLVAVYGFLLFRIKTLSNAQPSPSEVSTQAMTRVSPHIDETLVKQLQALQDNSVSVKTLFNEARNNPFQE
ncbi:MAG TPA: hypothetical protein VLG37_05200 [Candidatus Saccharimonadales bacterium]|nr:hypothetical protein [Candidatus Saccharimonadales bacterium]